ncbi:hypothetical protein LSTR_LSTR003429 [Laodelphax striatellus]|uniref:Uncharacterized protein n=1 Tax=Laodelphax striatellus TaxID=195883 RepID=A0A482X2L4_LAOST|nr:hypothetical protein LSTR_LSTR003429 [Laodelphax striatellus]
MKTAHFRLTIETRLLADTPCDSTQYYKPIIMSAYYYAIVLVAMASLSTSWGAVLPYSSSAIVKSERNGDNFAYSISQNQ